MRNANNSGFTMVEMAIVLIAIGFIVASVVVARDLINSSGARSVISEVNAIKESVRGFRDRYRQLPGDFNQAVNRTVTETIGGVTTTRTIPGIWNSVNPSTANGDGDGIIESPNTDATPQYEDLRAWQHLTLANGDGVNSQYTGNIFAAAPVSQSRFKVNIPESKIGGAGYRLLFTAPSNNIELESETRGAAIDPIRASFIDKKIDDGVSGTGEVFTISGAPCITGATPPNYNTTIETAQCKMSFRIRN